MITRTATCTTFYMWFIPNATCIEKSFSKPFSIKAKERFLDEQTLAWHEERGYQLVKMTSDIPITVQDWIA